MTKINIMLSDGQPGYKFLLNSAQNSKKSKVAYMRENGFVNHLINGYKCTPEQAEFIKQQMYAIVDWLEEHQDQDPPQFLFDGLRDAGYISDEDYAKLEPKSNFIPRCPVCGSPDLKVISGLHRAASFGAFGFASSTARAQRQCKNCGYKF